MFISEIDVFVFGFRDEEHTEIKVFQDENVALEYIKENMNFIVEKCIIPDEWDFDKFINDRMRFEFEDENMEIYLERKQLILGFNNGNNE